MDSRRIWRYAAMRWSPLVCDRATLDVRGIRVVLRPPFQDLHWAQAIDRHFGRSWETAIGPVVPIRGGFVVDPWDQAIGDKGMTMTLSYPLVN